MLRVVTFIVFALITVSAADRGSYILRNIERTDTNEYIGVSDHNGRVRLRTKPCKFHPANDQTAIVDVFESPAYKETYITFEAPKIQHDIQAQIVCEVLQVTRY